MPTGVTTGGDALPSPGAETPGGPLPGNRRPTPRQSIRGRLRRLVILSVGIALICSAILSVWQATTSYLVDKRESLLGTANVLAGVSSRAVAAADTALIKDSLRSIGRLPTVAYARIENTHRQILAEAGGAVRLDSEVTLNPEASDALYTFLRTRTIQVSVPIVYGGRSVGSVILVRRIGDLATRFLGIFAIASLGALLAIAVGLLIAHRLQRSITLPLGALAADMARIARTQDYSASVPATADLETEQLAGSFNLMIDEIR